MVNTLEAEPVQWEIVADQFCDAWSTSTGEPDYATLAGMYAPDDDVVIFDSLPPLRGFRGFDDMRGSIYDEGLVSLKVVRAGPVDVRRLADGNAVVVSYSLDFEYEFADGPLSFGGRISQVWERRGERYVIVHEHPSTVIDQRGAKPRREPRDR